MKTTYETELTYTLTVRGKISVSWHRLTPKRQTAVKGSWVYIAECATWAEALAFVAKDTTRVRVR